MLALSLAVLECYAHVQHEQTEAPAKVAKLNEPGSDASAADVGGTTAAPSHVPSSVVSTESTATITKELEAMKLRIQQLRRSLASEQQTNMRPWQTWCRPSLRKTLG